MSEKGIGTTEAVLALVKEISKGVGKVGGTEAHERGKLKLFPCKLWKGGDALRGVHRSPEAAPCAAAGVAQRLVGWLVGWFRCWELWVRILLRPDFRVRTFTAC